MAHQLLSSYHLCHPQNPITATQRGGRSFLLPPIHPRPHLCHLRRTSFPDHHNKTTTFLSLSHDGGGNGISSSGGGGDGGGGGNDDENPAANEGGGSGIVGLFLNGWRSRVAADPELPFKLLMEELVGLSSCVLGDMASRPNFGLNELDFVFSTLVVGAIVNIVLIYVLAPTATATATAAVSTSSSSSFISSIFANSPKGHMFESGAYTALDRLGTLVYKGLLFSAVGFAAGLLGTAISNGLIAVRKKMDPHFETPNKPPPTVLNALTWAAHLGLSCNLRYQTLTGVEFLLARGLPPLGFKASVIALRCLNNIFGGVSFVMMARFTGSQHKAQEEEPIKSNSMPANPSQSLQH